MQYECPASKIIKKINYVKVFAIFCGVSDV